MPTVSPQQWNTQDAITSSKLNTPINQIAAVLNGGLDDANIGSVSGTKVNAATLPVAAFTVDSNPETRMFESFGNFVASGCVWSISSGLNGAMALGVIYINGKRVPVALIASRTFTANKDTYVSVDITGMVSYSEVANNAPSPTLPTNSIWLAKPISNGTAIMSISQSGRTSIGDRIRPQSGATQSVYLVDAVQHSYSTTQVLLTATLQNAPAGDYLIGSTFAIEPNGGGNASVNISHSSTTGVLVSAGNTEGGIHAADADFSTSKYAHRTMSNALVGHQGGSFTVTLTFQPESAVAYQIGNSGDARWATTLTVVRA